MYYFLHGSKYISANYLPSSIKGMVSSKTFSSVTVYNDEEIFIFDHKTCILSGYFKRSSDLVDAHGVNDLFEWSMESNQFAISTNKNFILLFAVNFIDNSNIMEETETSLSLFTVKTVLPVGCDIQFLDVISFTSNILCLSLYRGDLLIATNDGVINRLKWDGRIVYNQQMPLHDILFYNDLEFSKDAKYVKCDSVCRKIEWFPSWNGVVLLFKNGKGAFLHIPNHVLNSKHVTGVWAESLKHANCVAVNVKFRSVVFGSITGEGIIYKFDEETGALGVQHVLKISSNKYPAAYNSVGAVIDLKWSPDNFSLVLLWECGAFSMWSAQGFLLFNSFGNSLGKYININSIEWGCEGYTLWAIEKGDKDRPELIVFSLVKSSLITNSTLNNQCHIILLGSNAFTIGLRNNLTEAIDPLETVMYSEIYLSTNWPVKFVSINNDATIVAVAGKCGFCFYFLQTQKWRFFGNEVEESSMEIVGGMYWYRKLLCMACFDNKKEIFEIRIYNAIKKIDDLTSIKIPVQNQILILNGFSETVITLTINGLVNIYSIIDTPDNEKCSLLLNQTISLENYIDFAVCVVSLHLSTLHSEIGPDDLQGNINEYNSLLVNYSGHLLMFQKDKYSIGKHSLSYVNSASPTTGRPKDPGSVYKESYFSGPIVVAYDVENIWIPYFENVCHIASDSGLQLKKYAMENSLWINCGSHGLKVWLSLKNNGSPVKHDKIRNSFLSKRIMLVCNIPEFYPLVVLNNTMLLMGISNEFLKAEGVCHPYPYIETKQHIFIHHLIKQLLRINLGIHALDLTNDLKLLPYFNHALELLLHEVLEEEATSKEPIPDPLLPRVIAFIQEFPDYLKVIVQCARKTELALWPYLFESAGDPKDLFENCLENNQPDVAASYLVILQNTEPPFMSQQHAIILMNSSLYQLRWNLVKDLIRFLRNIALNDSKLAQSYKETNIPFIRLQKRRFRSGGYSGIKYMGSSHSHSQFSKSGSKLSLLSSVNKPDKLSEEMFIDTSQSLFAVRYQNARTAPASFTDERNSASKSPPPSFFNDMSGMDGLESAKTSNLFKEVYQIITRFAHDLFEEYRLLDLFELVTNVGFSEHQFYSWLSREREVCSKISEPIAAMKRLHQDFHWTDLLKWKEKQMLYDGVDAAASTKVSQYIPISREFTANKAHRISERKLRYAANVLSEAKYWQWSILILTMLDDINNLSLLIESLTDSETNATCRFIRKLRYEFKSSEFSYYRTILFNVRLRQRYNSAIEYSIVEDCEDVSSSHSEKNESSVLLSPSMNHSFALGQLEIDVDQSKVHFNKNEKLNANSEDGSLSSYFGNCSLSTPPSVIAPLVVAPVKTNKFDILRNNHNFKNQKELLASFQLIDDENNSTVVAEPLISIGLEDNPSKGCSIS